MRERAQVRFHAKYFGDTMKRLNLILAAIAVCVAVTLSANGFGQKTEAAKPAGSKPLNVAFLVYKNVEVLDLSGPLDVFTKASHMAPGTYNLYTVGTDAGLTPGEDGILSIKPRYTIRDCPSPDILVVPGAPMEAIQAASANRPLIQWLQQKAPGSRLVMSVCTGAFLLGRAGLLDNRKSTTHWFVLDEFQKQFPKTTAMQGVRFVQDGKVVTAAGVSSGIDGALHVVEKTSGKQVADGVSRVIQYRRGTPAFPEQKPGKLVAGRAVKSAPRVSGRKLFSNTDPVCGMKVDARTKLTHEHKGRLYGFCAAHCRDTFAARPEPYLKSTRQPH